NLFSSILIVCLSYVFLNVFSSSLEFRYFIESLLKVDGIVGTEVLMLPLAYSVGTLINGILLWISVKKDFMPREYFIAQTFFQSLAAAFLSGTIAYFALNAFASVFNLNTFWGIFYQGFFAGVLGIISCVLILHALGNKELANLFLVLKTKFWKTKVIVPDQENM
ncbi:MAG: hypothetical protein ACKOW9_02290, partial [Candidatus Paceibacterota bacterium]